MSFSGTLRFNLDPLCCHSDAHIWEALRIAQLQEIIQNTSDSLDTQVSEGGENFSVGQRQLFCIARAFLRDTQILIMDEATASIDKQMDRLLQTVIATAFSDKTVITIAHRVTTILDYDKVLVLHDGRVREYGAPCDLMKIENGDFASMVKENR